MQNARQSDAWTWLSTSSRDAALAKARLRPKTKPVEQSLANHGPETGGADIVEAAGTFPNAKQRRAGHSDSRRLQNTSTNRVEF